MKKKIHAVISRANIAIERYTTNVPIQRNPLVVPGRTACLDSVIPFTDAVIQSERREGGQKLGGGGEVVIPIEMHRFNVREEKYFVCDKDCIECNPAECTGIPISKSEFYDDEKSADDLAKKHSKKAPVDTREEAQAVI